MFWSLLALRRFSLDFLVPSSLFDALILNGYITVSLKSFHIFFILVSVILTLIFGGWCIKQEGTIYLVSAILSFILGVSLSLYLFFFIKKMRNLPDSRETF